MTTAIRNLAHLDRFRIPLRGDMGDARNGAFKIPSPVMGMLVVLCSADEGWDHVSVSLANRTPTWAEMDWIKRAFFEPEAVAMQLHVAESNHISFHPHCLHLWRPWSPAIPLPPAEFVA